MYGLIFKFKNYSKRSNLMYDNINDLKSKISIMGFKKVNHVLTDGETVIKIIKYV